MVVSAHSSSRVQAKFSRRWHRRAVAYTLYPLVSIAACAAALTAHAAPEPPIADAAQKRARALIETLLVQHADVNVPQPDGATALAWAAHWDDLDTADLLIDAGARANAANDYGITPLALACSNGSAPMVDRLVKAGADP